MTVLVTNNDVIDFTSYIVNPQVLTDSTYHDSDYTTYAIQVNDNDIVKQDFTASTQGWIHWHNYVDSGVTHSSVPAGIPLFTLTNGAGDNFLRSVQEVHLSATPNPWRFEYWDGAAWITMTDDLPRQEKQYIDIEFNISTGSGFWIVYLDGQEIGRFEGKTDHNGTTVSSLSFLGDTVFSTLSTFTAISQVIVTNSESTIDMRLATIEIDGEGATSDWTGLFTDVNEQAIDVNTKITSGSANDVSTYTVTNLSANVLASAFLNILSVNVHHYVRDNAGTPSDVQQVVRVSSTDFFSPTDTGIGPGYALSINRFTTNPDTTNPWALTDIASLEIGAKSI